MREQLTGKKYTFKNNSQNESKWTNIGLWKYARHPNYFGEMTCWWGLFIFIVPYLSGPEYLSVIGPIFITFLPLFVSGIPPLERAYKEKYNGNAEYQKYRNSIHLLIPIPGKNGK